MNHAAQLLFALAALSAPLAWAATHIRLEAALQQLRADGVPIVYSTALVPPDLYIDPEAVTLEGVRSALPSVGLALDNRAGAWLLVEGPRLAAPPSSAVGDDASDRTSRIETVIVTGTRHRFETIGGESANVLSSEELDRAPTLGGDSLRSANLLPGMSSMGVSVRPRVRGGLDDEMLVLVDGIEILDPYHFSNYQNLFSAIDGRTIDDVDVYSGGYPARYGNRMSGVMAINTLAQREKPTAELGVSMYSAFANTRNPDPNSTTSWLASARYGQSDILLERLGLQAGRPSFSDAAVRVGQQIDTTRTLYAGAMHFSEDIDLNSNRQNATWRNDSDYLWSRYDATIDDRVSSSTVVSYVSLRHQTRDVSPPPESASGFLDDSQDTQRVALRSDFAFATGDVRQEFGIQADWTRTNYNSTATIDRGAFGVLLDGQAVTNHEIATTIDGTSVGLYWTADYPITSAISLQPGLRWDLQTAQGTNAEVSPRLGVKWQAGDDLTLRFDAGRFYQPNAVYEMDTADGIDHLFKPQRADHYIGSATWRWSSTAQIRLDAYEKQYSRTTPRFENLFNPFVLLPQVAPDRVEIDASRARAQGIDFEFQDELTPRMSMIARYSYMDADDKIGGQWVSRRWSQAQTVTGIALWKSESFSASASVSWHSGWRTSAPPASVPVGTTIPIADIANNRILEDYFSVDLGFSASRPLWRSTVTVFGDITNTLNRDNTVGVDYTAQQQGAAVTFLPDDTSLLPIVPWVGIVIAF
jgi:hypothetical protein